MILQFGVRGQSGFRLKRAYFSEFHTVAEIESFDVILDILPEGGPIVNWLRRCLKGSTKQKTGYFGLN